MLDPRDPDGALHSGHGRVRSARLAQSKNRKQRPSALQWASAIYAVAFFFAAWANSVMLLVTLLAGRYQQGPYHLGTFTLLLVVTYVLTAGLSRHASPA